MKKSWFLDKFKVRHFISLMMALAVIMLASGAIFYWWGGERVEQSLVDRVLVQEQLLVRSGAAAIGNYFQDKKAHLLVISQLPSVIAGNSAGEKALDALAQSLREKSDLVDVVGWADQTGLVVGGNRVGTGQKLDLTRNIDLSDRDYFLWAKEQKRSDKVFVSEPLKARGGLTEGYWNVVMAAPLLSAGEFRGVLFLSLPIQGLTAKFVEPLTDFRETKIFLVDQNQVVAATNYSELVGENVNNFLQAATEEEEFELKERLKRALGGEAAAFTGDCFIGGKKEKSLFAYSPVEFNGTIWTLWTCLPYEKVWDFASPLTNLQTQGFLMEAIGLVLLLAAAIFGLRFAQTKGFIDGFRNGLDRVKKAKKR